MGLIALVQMRRAHLAAAPSNSFLSQSTRGKILLSLIKALNRIWEDEWGYTEQFCQRQNLSRASIFKDD